MGSTAKIKTSSTGSGAGGNGKDSGAETVSLLSKMLGKLGVLSILLSLKPVVDLISATISLIAFYLFKFFSMFPAFVNALQNAYDIGEQIVLDTFGFFKSLFTGEIDIVTFFKSYILNPILNWGTFLLENLILNPINSWVSFVLGLFGNPEPFDIIKWVQSLLLGETGGGNNGGSSAIVSVPVTSPLGNPQGPTGGSSPLMGPGAGGQSANELDTFAYISNAIANGIIGGNSSIGSGAGGGGTFNFYGLTTDEVVDKIQSVVRIDQSRATRF